MIHPSVPAIMVTPICPHSLSFRPIVVPAGVELKVGVLFISPRKMLSEMVCQLSQVERINFQTLKKNLP